MIVDCNGAELGLGDKVRHNGGKPWAYSDSTIVAVFPDGTVDLFRVYVHTSDVCFSGREGGSRLIAYTGHEDVRNVNASFYVLVEKFGREIR